MPVLIVTPRTDISATHTLLDAAKKRGWEAIRAEGYKPDIQQNEVVLYGETLFTTMAARHLKYAILEPTFDWLAHISRHYLLRDVAIMTLQEARKITVPKFVKAADGNKAIHAEVYTTGQDLPSRYISQNLPVLVSDPVSWQTEFRFFILNRAIATFSIYARDGNLEQYASPEEQSEAQAFCQKILSDDAIAAPPAWVLDVGYIENSSWAIVEPNPVSSSGIYQCDPDKVLDALQRACIPINTLSDSDKQWAVERPI
jgi:hypothetical protein